MSEPYDMLAAMRDLAATLPTRVPTTLRVGPGVAELLRYAAEPARSPLGLPLGVRIVPDDSYRPGEWRLLDQLDTELHSGQVEALDGMPAGTTVLTSPYLPPGVIAVAVAPSDLHPDDPGYIPLARRVAVIRDGQEPLGGDR